VTTPLVLLPGLLCDGALWAPIIDALADVAHCHVADLARDDGVRAMAHRVLDEAPWPEFALAGFSMGGYVAFEVMRQAPGRITRLALLDTGAGPDSPERAEERRRGISLARSDKGFTTIAHLLLSSMLHPDRADDPVLGAVLRTMAERVGREGYVRQQTAILGRPDSRPSLVDIRCPTLVLCGRDDRRAPLAWHEEMAAGIPGAVLEIIEDSGHMVTLEQPAATAAALRRWLMPGSPSLGGA
jgi:pimeloyl-ACP methyl ester carboxylesterase